MAFDPRSRQRLEELGRRLPQPLPSPGELTAEQPRASGRHRIETETDPEQLFGALMRASPDGSVPPHLLDRLRQLEQRPGRSLTEPTAVRSRSRSTSAGEPTDPRYVEFEQMLLEDEAL